MKTLVGIVFFYCLTATQFASSQPDKDWWACQVVETAGLLWESNSWEVSKFEDSAPFVLVSDGKGLLSTRSVAKAILGDDRAAQFFDCRTKEGDVLIYCSDVVVNSSLSFNPELGIGATSYIYGGVTLPGTENQRDAVAVTTFECVKG